MKIRTVDKIFPVEVRYDVCESALGYLLSLISPQFKCFCSRQMLCYMWVSSASIWAQVAKEVIFPASDHQGRRWSHTHKDSITLVSHTSLPSLYCHPIGRLDRLTAQCTQWAYCLFLTVVCSNGCGGS